MYLFLKLLNLQLVISNFTFVSFMYLLNHLILWEACILNTGLILEMKFKLQVAHLFFKIDLLNLVLLLHQIDWLFCIIQFLLEFELLQLQIFLMWLFDSFNLCLIQNNFFKKLSSFLSFLLKLSLQLLYLCYLLFDQAIIRLLIFIKFLL